MYKKIIHTECGCLNANDVFDENCRKRYLLIKDVYKGEYFYLGICNQYIGLLLQEKKIEMGYANFHQSYEYANIIENILNEYIEDITPHYYRTNGNQNDIANRYLRFTVCDRPWISTSINVIDAIGLVTKKRNYIIEEKLWNDIENYLTSSHIYNKYKTKYRDCFKLIRKIKHTYGSEKEVIINELFLKIYEMNINHKKQLI